jgi:basic amino acid/polyamine antiporter, APA family
VAPTATWASAIVAFGSVIAHTAVLLVFQMGQPRIFFSMARDGLLPPALARVHPRFKTPHVPTIITGVAVGTVAAFASIDEMVDLTNIGTLFAFVLVCIGIPILRYKDPDRKRPFRVPLGPWVVPMLGVISCLFLMVYLPPASWWRFVGWLALGLSIYLAYGYCRSTLGREAGRPTRTPGTLKVAAMGMFATAVGLFAMPHNLSPLALFSAAASGQLRSLLALGGVVLGLAATAASLVTERRKPGPTLQS